MVEKDFSKCQCPKAGWCDLLQKEMTATPPNWQWCQGITEEERKEYHKKTSSRVKTLRQAIKASEVDVVNFVDDISAPTSDYAVCVIPANQSAMDLLDITRDSIKSYAKKCGADYIELSGDQHPAWPMANKYRLHKVTSTYKKTLYLDCDIFVRPESPNIFEITPDNRISAYDEWEIWEDKKETLWIQREQEVIVRKTLDKEAKHRLINNGKFTANAMINGGVMVIPQSLSDVYKQPKTPYPRQWCFDQHCLSLLLDKSKFHNLDKKFNLEYVNPDFFSTHEDAYFLHINNLRKKPHIRTGILQSLVEGNDLIDLNKYDKLLKLGSDDGNKEIEYVDTTNIKFNDIIPEMKNNYAVCVINADDYTEQQLGITRERIVAYARRCNADYIELTGNEVPEYPMYNKYRLYQVTSLYEKTLYVDCDIVIKDNVPDIFLETPDDKISIHNELSFLDWRMRWSVDNQAGKCGDFIYSQTKASPWDREKEKYGDKRSFNAGVMVIPKVLCEAYKLPIDEKVPKVWCLDQIKLGVDLKDEHFHELGNKWNCSFKHTTYKEYNQSAYFIHHNNPKSTRIPSLNWSANKEIKGLYTEFGCVPTLECAHHRSGWNQICISLLKENSDNGIYIDAALENAFAWKKHHYESVCHIPFTMPWIGFFHNPPHCPDYLKEITGWGGNTTIDAIIDSDNFKNSMHTCKGLLSLSSHLADYLHEKTGLPTMSLKHPISDFKFPQWNPDRAREQREICFIGYWYRKFQNFLRLNTSYQKSFLGGDERQLMWYLEGECEEFDISFTKENYLIYQPLVAPKYDQKLVESIVFLDFWDTACNTSLVDCMARNTPVIIPRHPAVIEYLGEDYPLYFDSVSDANEIVNDFDRIISGHEYLKQMDKSDMTEEYFLNKLRKWHDYIKK